MDVTAYLNRIKVKNARHLDLAFLTTLQVQHLLNIYFENIDIIVGKTLSLDVEKQYKKIIENERGGVCFELNGLFHYLLKQLGYQVRMIAATVHKPDGWFTIENSHMTNLVHLGEQTYLVDVGFGGNSPRLPIPINGEEVLDVDGIYRISQGEGFYIFEKKEKEDWQPLYRFKIEEKNINDFIDQCHIIETSVHSPFNKGYFLSKVTKDGRITLTDHSLTIVEKGIKKKLNIKKDRMPSLIKKYYHISI